MRDDSKNGTSEAPIARKAQGNPAGKGLNGFLLDWHRSQPRGVAIKTERQLLAEFFTSMLALSASFKYKPAVGVENYLYWYDSGWQLSLIAPDEWSADRKAGFAGTCTLQRDMTWTIDPSENLSRDTKVSAAVARFYESFADKLDTDLVLEDVLPFYVGQMPYYQRLYASALSRSISAAVVIGDQRYRPCRQWQALLPGLEPMLFPPAAAGTS